MHERSMFLGVIASLAVTVGLGGALVAWFLFGSVVGVAAALVVAGLGLWATRT